MILANTAASAAASQVHAGGSAEAAQLAAAALPRTQGGGGKRGHCAKYYKRFDMHQCRAAGTPLSTIGSEFAQTCAVGPSSQPSWGIHRAHRYQRVGGEARFVASFSRRFPCESLSCFVSPAARARPDPTRPPKTRLRCVCPGKQAASRACQALGHSFASVLGRSPLDLHLPLTPLPLGANRPHRPLFALRVVSVYVARFLPVGAVVLVPPLQRPLIGCRNESNVRRCLNLGPQRQIWFADLGFWAPRAPRRPQLTL